MMGHSAKSGKHFYYICSRNYKQGKDSCTGKMIPKEKIERAVIEKVKDRILTDENLEELVKLVNEEIGNASSQLTNRIAAINDEMCDIESRLEKLYDALETGKYEHDHLAPRLTQLKARQDELGKARILAEAERDPWNWIKML